MNKILFQNTEQLKEFSDFLVSDKSPQTEYPIHIKHSETSDDIIFFEIEQYSDNVDWSSHYQNLKNENIKEIWTFSNFNIKKLEENGITKAKYIEILPTDEYREKLLSFNVDNKYDYDVCFIGWLSDRRCQIAENLRQRGVFVKLINIYDSVYGDERDKIIAKSKILLNIHYNEHFKCFEQIRCFPWLNTGKVIVSESSYDTDDRVIFADYDKLVDKVIEVLETKF